MYDLHFLQSPIIAEVRPQDYLVMSILNCIFCNCILGIIAIIFSSTIKSQIKPKLLFFC